MTPRLGIAITTFNRRDLVTGLCAAIRLFTKAPYDLVICDDGSSDGTVEVLKSLGETVIGGRNGGIARNKNRGIWYLLNQTHADVILLLDDDVVPGGWEWERDWIDASIAFGHVNYPLPHRRENGVIYTAAAPALVELIRGCALAFSRGALTSIGFMDPRFGRYGHEHSDLSFRAVHAGFGGHVRTINGQEHTLFYVVDGGLTVRAAESSGTSEERAANLKLLGALRKEQIYRHAWRDDTERAEFLSEITPL